MYGKYDFRPQEWKEQLNNHLLKSEIQWVADHGGAEIDFLKPYCGDIKTLKEYLRSIGFKLKREFHKTEDSTWIYTSDGISITVEDGFCIRNKY